MIEKLSFDLKKPEEGFQKVTMLIYGVPKVGKSTFCSRIEDHFFIATEPGISHLETRSQRVNSFDELKRTIELLAQNRDKFKTVVIDTADKMCDMIERSILEKYAVKSLNDLGYGKGTALFKNTLKETLDSLVSMDCGLVFISHCETVDFETPTGSIKKWGPSLSKDARRLIGPLVDIIGFAECEYVIENGKPKDSRILHLAPSKTWEAGDRTRKLPPVIPFKYAVFKSFFDRKEQKPGECQDVKQDSKQETKNG